MFLVTATISNASSTFSSFWSSLTPSDWLQFWGIIAATITSIVSTIIAVITLRQNKKMIEESTRPVISIYTQSINPGVPMLYLIVKNFGQSPAYMTKFESDFDFSDCYGKLGIRNFIEDFGKCVIAPGQSKTCWLDYDKITHPVHFSIEYKSSTKTYSESFDIDLKAAASMPTQKYATDGKELRSVSYSLQEILLKNL